MADTAEKAKNLVDYWAREIDSAKQRWKPFTEQAHRVTAIYEAEKQADNAFNILFANTETLLPSLYNVTPRAQVGRRYKDDNLLGRLAAKVLERGLEYHMDLPDPDYSPFDGLMESATLSSLVPGMGVTRVKYDATFRLVDGASSDKKEDKDALMAKGTEDDSGDVAAPIEDPTPPPKAEEVEYETVCGEEVSWDAVLFGPGKVWKRIPWVAFKHSMTRLDAARAFGKATAGKLTYRVEEGKKADPDEDKKRAGDQQGTAEVWEVWHRTTKKVYFVCPNWKDGLLKEPVDDPFGLQGFFPIPEPLILFSRVKEFIPRQLYLFYENQAKELNRVTVRINKLVDALKVRGFYGAGLNGLSDLLTKPENTLVAAQSQGMMVENPNIANWIWLVPIEKIVTVLQQLYIQREQVKRVIYEVTGLSDIVRGSTVASETATAQNLKSQYGTLRLKKMQKRVQIYVRDYLRLVAELMVEKLGPKTWAAMTGVKLPTGQEKAEAQRVMAEMQQRQQMMQSSGQGPPSNGPLAVPGGPPAGQGQGPPPPPMDPKMEKILSMPSWDEVLGMLKDDLLRNYNIDIETNSTIEPDAVEDQAQIAKLMGAMSNMFSSMGPVVEKGALPMPAFKAMLMGVARRFRFGDMAEEALEQIPDQLPSGGDDKGKEKELQLKLQVTEKETQNKMQLMDKELEIAKAELDIKAEELQLKREELQIKKEAAVVKRRVEQINSEGKVAAAQAKTQAAIIASQAPQQPQAPQGANPGQVPAGAGVPANAPV